jgi:branched-chain amino acid transport system permease protein
VATPVDSLADTRALGEQRDVEKWREADRGEPPKVPEREPAGSWVVASIKDALVAGLVAAALGLFFIGLTTDGPSGPLAVRERWGPYAIMVGIVFGARLLLDLVFFKNPRPARVDLRRFAVPSDYVSTASKTLGALFLLIALFLPFLLLQFVPGQSRQYLDLAILILTYVMLGWGLNIVVGLAGLLDLGYVAFYAVGAYSFALIAQNFDLGFWICLPVAGILAAFWGIILGFPVLRLRGDYLAIVTLAFGEIIRIVLLNWYDFTGGPNGITGIPKPTLFGLDPLRLGVLPRRGRCRSLPRHSL